MPQTSMHPRRPLRSVPAILLLAILEASCLDSPSPSAGSPAAQGVEIAVVPPSAVVPVGGRQAFASTVTGTADVATTWQIQEAGCGTVTADGLYTAPAASATCHVVATSHADPTKSAAALVTVQAAPPLVTIAVSPALVTVAASGQTTFTATVTGTTDTAASWRVQEAGCGTVTAGGVYTAPAVSATCHVVATSHADPSRTAAATVTVTGPPPVVTVTVTPGSTSVFGCQTASLSASVTGTSNTAVTWSVTEAGGGTVSAAGVYTAPEADGTYHVVATSAAAPSASATATITVTTQVLSVSVSPSTVTLPPGGTAQLTATVTTSCGVRTSLARLQAPPRSAD